MVERWGCEDPACGIEGLCNIHWSEKKQKKKKKHIFTCVGNGSSGCGGLHA